MLAEKATNGLDQFFQMFSQVLVMFLFTVLDYKESYADESMEFSLLINDPLKITACARHIVETSYDMLLHLDQDDAIHQQVAQIEHLLIKIETQIADQGLKLFVDNYDENITMHISTLTKLDYLDSSKEILKVTQMSLFNLKRQFKSFAQESQTYLPKSLLKEHIVQRKLSEYLRLLIFQVTSQVDDLSVTANDLLVKLVAEFHELYNYFTLFTESDFKKLGVKEVQKLKEL